MAKLKFRVTTIALDDEEDVASVTAIVRDDAYQVLTGILGWEPATATARGGTEMTVELSAADMMTLLRECGSISSYDPRYDAGSGEIYAAMNWIYYSLMDD